MSQEPALRIAATDPDGLSQANRLAADHGLAIVDEPVSNWRHGAEPGLLLLVDRGGLALVNSTTPHLRPLQVDFSSATLRRRMRQASPRSEALGRAVGIGKWPGLRIIDATAGLGRDAFLLASLGCDVLLIERQPVLMLLLADGLRRARTSDDRHIAATAARMQLVQADARQLMSGNPSLAVEPTVICIDPMFTDGRGSAAAGREMSYLQALPAAAADSAGLLAAALATACRRVVVKRPLRAEVLEGFRPSHDIRGKSTRFDVYVNAAVAAG